jgi:formiminotetrahydrofolate cyclodeaminase
MRLAQEVATIGNQNARSDATVAVALARAALIGALENVRVNVAALSDQAVGTALRDEAERLGQALTLPP